MAQKYKGRVLHGLQVEKVQVQVTENTTALKEATGVLTGSKRTVQDLDIKLQTAHKRVSKSVSRFSLSKCFGTILALKATLVIQCLANQTSPLPLNRTKLWTIPFVK